MNQEEKWTGERAKGREAMEIAILATVLVLALFGLAMYLFFQKLSNLSEQTELLSSRIAALEQQLVQSYQPSESQVVTRAEPESAAKTATHQNPHEELTGRWSSIEPKKIETFKVRPDGTIIETRRAPTSKQGEGLSNFGTKKVNSISADVADPGNAPRSDPGNTGLKIGSTIVDVQRCTKTAKIINCEVKILLDGESLKDVVISNKGTFAVGFDNAKYRVSSFQTEQQDDRQYNRSKVSLIDGVPLNVRFQFQSVPSTLPALQSLHFNIGGNTFVFGSIMVDLEQGISPSAIDEGRDFAEHDLSYTFRPFFDTVGGPVVIGDVEANVLGCGDARSYFFCDLLLTNQGPSGRSISVSYENSLLRDENDTVLPATSFSIGKVGHKLHHNYQAFLSVAHPLTLRFRFYNPQTKIQGLKGAEFNVDGEVFEFRSAAAKGGLTSEKPEERQPTLPPSHSQRPKQIVNNVSADLQYCERRGKYFYCSLELTNIGPIGRDVIITKDKSFVTSFQNATYRVSGFSINGADRKNYHHKVAFLEEGKPLNVGFRFFDPPSGIARYKTLQLNIDGQQVVFENVQIDP
ncbi:hypothetical protein [uncultured Roseibium sp.]|uniref:hypothetical protein n=1 Tax=uncultured Roseibium sp. TaxID=1936171 RepID=UPI00260F70B3|nr:hypothetical protein [uncultured Roseibium sp.]